MQPAVGCVGRGSTQNHPWCRCLVLLLPLPPRLSVPEQVNCCTPRTVKRLPPLQPLAPAQKLKLGLESSPRTKRPHPACPSVWVLIKFQAQWRLEPKCSRAPGDFNCTGSQTHMSIDPSFSLSGCLFSR